MENEPLKIVAIKPKHYGEKQWIHPTFQAPGKPSHMLTIYRSWKHKRNDTCMTTCIINLTTKREMEKSEKREKILKCKAWYDKER